MRVRDDEVTLRSSALAFATILSLVPLIAVMSTFLARTLREDDGELVDLVVGLLPYREEAVVEAIRSFTDQAGSISGIAVIGFLVVTVLTFLGVQESLFKIFRVERPPSYTRRLVTFSMLFLWGPLVIGAAQTGLVLFAQWSPQFSSVLRESFLLRALPAVLTFPALALFYWRAALGQIRLRHAAFGALTATIALEVLKGVFAFYVSEWTEVQRAVYGTFAIALFFVLSVQLAWFILLLGAELAADSANGERDQAAAPRGTSVDDPWRTLVLLAALVDRDEPEERKSAAALAERAGTTEDEVDRLLAPLVERGLLLPPRGEETTYRLAVPPAELRLTRILEAHPVAEPTAEAEAGLLPLITRLVGAARAELAGLTLADLAGGARARPEPPPLSDDTLSNLVRERVRESVATKPPDPFAAPADPGAGAARTTTGNEANAGESRTERETQPVGGPDHST